MQNFRVIQIASGNLEKECDRVEQNQRENCRRGSELAMPNTARDWSGSESNRAVLVRFRMPKQLNLIPQLGAGMQDLKSCSESCSRFVVSLSGELRHFAQSNRREEQKREPRDAADVSGSAAQKNPGYTAYCQNN
jgi:hypothetical protein